MRCWTTYAACAIATRSLSTSIRKVLAIERNKRHHKLKIRTTKCHSKWFSLTVLTGADVEKSMVECKYYSIGIRRVHSRPQFVCGAAILTLWLNITIRCYTLISCFVACAATDLIVISYQRQQSAYVFRRYLVDRQNLFGRSLRTITHTIAIGSEFIARSFVLCFCYWISCACAVCVGVPRTPSYFPCRWTPI